MAGLLILGLGCLMFLVIMVRKKRSLHGTYNPQKQEINGHRFEMTEMDVFKKPNEERLIWVPFLLHQKISPLSNSFCSYLSLLMTFYSDLTTMMMACLAPCAIILFFFSMISIHRKLSLFSLHINYQKKHISAVFILSNSEKWNTQTKWHREGCFLTGLNHFRVLASLRLLSFHSMPGIVLVIFRSVLVVGIIHCSDKFCLPWFTDFLKGLASFL